MSTLKAIRQAATLLVIRDAPGGPEVLMLRRVERADDRMSGAFVFPGGAVDAGDRRLHGLVNGLDDAAASRLLDVPADGLDFHIAAIRECFEESGLLFAVDREGAPVVLPLPAGEGWGEGAREARRSPPSPQPSPPPGRGSSDGFERLCTDHGWRLAVDQLAYFGHWLTPAGLKKRFDTRFFAAIAPAGQTAAPDGHETIAHVWIRPADALKPDSGLKLMQITRHMLRWASRFETAAACIAHVRALPAVRLQVPRIAVGRAGPRTILPDEPAYAEIGRLDPDGTRHDVRHEIDPGVAVRLSPRVIRLTAPNAGMMTGPGTNSYLVGGGATNEWAVIDPGPDEPGHIAALLAAAPGPIRAILVTHTHTDHSPGTARLREATGAKVFGRIADHPERQDPAFHPDHVPRHGERITVGDTALRVVHTPGHASNHLCFLLEAEKTLFTGDHVMQGSTVVIGPPDGDMSAYLASLGALRHEDLDWLAPGHGFLIGDPQAAFDGLIQHRLGREAKVRGVLEASDRSTLDALVPRVYDDVDPRLHAVARRSLLAHLHKLAKDGVADENEEGWASIRRER